VYANQSGSVVNITSLALTRTPFGTAQQQGVGTGFIIDTNGHIVTNNHVVQDANQLTVTLKNSVTVPATLVGRDEPNDLAVVKVDPTASDDRGNVIQQLRPVILGDSDRVVIGNSAIAIGSPLGLQQTVTAGIISALRNPLEEAGRGQVDLLGGAIQTDSAINPGNSGGPLFNAQGEVIGVNTAILSQSGGNIGIGFAIPVNVVKRVVPELIRHGCYRHPFIGVTTISLARLGQALKQQLGVPQNQNGLLIQEVTGGAEQAGIRAGDRVVSISGEQLRVGGDIIVAIDGREVAAGGDLRAYIENMKRPGDSSTLTVLRDGQRADVRITLSERPDSQDCR
jgi:S1-C subfamily serine protease